MPSSRQGGASSSRARSPSRLEEREREERSRRSTRRPDRSSGDRGQSPPRKRRCSRSPSALSFSGSDNVSLHPSDSLSNEVDGESEMHAPTLPASVPPGADAGRSGSRTSRDRSPQPGPSFQTQSDAAPRERRAGERRDARSFPAAPGGEEDERAGSTEPPVLEKDAPFRQVLKSIRDYHGFPTPPETTPHPDRSAMARHLGLPLDHAPALHLPASQLTKALIDDVRMRAVQVPAPLETAHLSLDLRFRLSRMRLLGSGVLASAVTRVHSLPLLEERAGSTEPPVLEKDAPFRQVLKSIRDYHGFPTPPETTPHPDCPAMARHLGLPLDHAPALHLPASQLTKALIDDVSAHMRKLGEDQTQGEFLPIPGRRSRRFY